MSASGASDPKGPDPGTDGDAAAQDPFAQALAEVEARSKTIAATPVQLPTAPPGVIATEPDELPDELDADADSSLDDDDFADEETGEHDSHRRTSAEEQEAKALRRLKQSMRVMAVTPPPELLAGIDDDELEDELATGFDEVAVGEADAGDGGGMLSSAELIAEAIAAAANDEDYAAGDIPVDDGMLSESETTNPGVGVASLTDVEDEDDEDEDDEDESDAAGDTERSAAMEEIARIAEEVMAGKEAAVRQEILGAEEVLGDEELLGEEGVLGDEEVLGEEELLGDAEELGKEEELGDEDDPGKPESRPSAAAAQGPSEFPDFVAAGVTSDPLDALGQERRGRAFLLIAVGFFLFAGGTVTGHLITKHGLAGRVGPAAEVGEIAEGGASPTWAKNLPVEPAPQPKAVVAIGAPPGALAAARRPVGAAPRAGMTGGELAEGLAAEARAGPATAAARAGELGDSSDLVVAAGGGAAEGAVQPDAERPAAVGKPTEADSPTEERRMPARLPSPTEEPPADLPADRDGGEDREEQVADDSTVESDPAAAQLAIASTPAGATVYVDGRLVGKAPVSVPATQRNVTVVVMAVGYQLYRADLPGAGRASVVLKEAKTLGGKAGIKVRCRNKNRYYVAVDGVDTGMVCPTERIKVDLGQHEVLVYDPVTDERSSYTVVVKDTHSSRRLRLR